MKELSLNILDIAMNSVKAEATRIDIEIRETEDELEFSVSDNGYGMSRGKDPPGDRPVLHHANDAQGRAGHPLPANGRRADRREVFRSPRANDRNTPTTAEQKPAQNFSKST